MDNCNETTDKVRTVFNRRFALNKRPLSVISWIQKAFVVITISSFLFKQVPDWLRYGLIYTVLALTAIMILALMFDLVGDTKVGRRIKKSLYVQYCRTWESPPKSDH